VRRSSTVWSHSLALHCIALHCQGCSSSPRSISSTTRRC
jgi:hypothetical protein